MMNPRLSGFAGLLAAGVLLIAQGCGKRAPEYEERSEYDAGPNVVQVTMREYAFGMPRVIPPGTTRFVVKNTGQIVHSFAIDGDGLSARLPEPLQPGESDELQVELPEGEYTVWCPIGNHADLGMRLTLEVRPLTPEERGEAPAEDEEEEDQPAEPEVTTPPQQNGGGMMVR